MPNPGLSSLPSLRETIEAHNLLADKRLGQHFLLDPNITDRIVSAAGNIQTDHILEIGPGPGGLTRSILAACPKHISVVELDQRFLPALDTLKDKSQTHLDIYHTDASRLDIEGLEPRPIKIIANLPYNVGTKLLIGWLRPKALVWEQAILMFQEEVVNRIVAMPNSSAYGRLAILCQSICEVHKVMTVPAGAFTPPPKVESAVVSLTPLPLHQRFETLPMLEELTLCVFTQRRKMLRRSLKPLAAKYKVDVAKWLSALDIDPTRRPETLELSEFHRMARDLNSHAQSLR